jgi:hypothetical protein
LVTLSDDVGVIQHAVEDVPNRPTGYCTDDVARAFMVAIARLRLVPDDRDAQRLASTYLAFLHDAQVEDGRFHNFMSFDRSWLDDIGTQDSNGRAIWALGYGMAFATQDSWRRLCARMFEKALGTIDWLTYMRSKAYAAIGCAHALAALPDLDVARGALSGFARFLSDAYHTSRAKSWEWFEDVMTYDNARLPEALLRAGFALHDDSTIAVGLRTLGFFTSTTIERGIYVPIGNHGWYPRDGERARYAQQPLEGVALVDAAFAAFDATGDPAHAATADLGLEWFYGRNSRTTLMVRGGGCYDGLEDYGANLNMGAESTLAYLASAYAVAARGANSLRIAR